MQVSWKNNTENELSLKKFLQKQGISHRMYSELKNYAGSFKINNQIISPSRKIKAGEVVTVKFPAEEANPEIAVSTVPLDIIYEDNNWIVVNKPAGLTSVPGPANHTDTLVNRLKGHLVDEGSENLRPHIVTRLDRFTSGLVLVAKNRLANSYANQELAKHEISKKYIAVVSGNIENEHGVINLPIGRDGNKFARIVMAEGQMAKTEYWVKKHLENATMLEVKLHTGRTHQIRVHFTHYQHPLLGDQLYDGPMNQGIKRQALHASELSFFDPFQRKELNFKADLPTDMIKYK